MPVTRRRFIIQGAGLVSVGLVMPKLWLSDARAQAGADRKIFVVIQHNGGNDGLNTLIPFTNARYHSLRPTLSFKESELKDAQGRSTILGSEPFALHPALSELKGLYDAGKVAIVRGVGYPDPNLSHFSSTDIWHTADPLQSQGDGWLGKYADIALFGESGLPAAAVGGSLPKSLFADKMVIPSINNFQAYTYQTDNRYPGDRNNQINTFNRTNNQDYPADSFISAIAGTSVDGVAGAAQVQAAVADYRSTVVYPTGNPLASGLKMVAQMAVTMPESNLFYVSMGGFDNHSNQIGNAQNDPANKLVGDHATLLRNFSEGVKAFYDDLAEHGLAQNTVMMQWSEFGRRPNENASLGTDHGTASVMFVIGDPVSGGLYGEQPSLEATALDSAGNLKYTVDFRSVYATILDRWLGVDSKSVLGAQYGNVGFLG